MNNTNTVTASSTTQQAPAPQASSGAVALRDQLAAIPFDAKTGIQIQNLGNATAIADLIVRGGYAPKGASVEYAAVAVIQGALLGLNPIQAIQTIAVVNGRPTLFGDGLAAVVKASPVYGGERVEWLSGKDGDDGADGAGCRVTVTRILANGEKQDTTEWFTVGDAKKAGLWGKQGPWTQYPRRMLRARALAWAYRSAFPDVLQGIRVYEEEEDNVIDVTPEQPDRAPHEEAPTTQRGARQAARLAGALRIDRPAPDPAPPVRAKIQEPVLAEGVNCFGTTAAKEEAAQTN